MLASRRSPACAPRKEECRPISRKKRSAHAAVLRGRRGSAGLRASCGGGKRDDAKGGQEARGRPSRPALAPQLLCKLEKPLHLYHPSGTRVSNPPPYREVRTRNQQSPPSQLRRPSRASPPLARPALRTRRSTCRRRFLEGSQEAPRRSHRNSSLHRSARAAGPSPQTRPPSLPIEKRAPQLSSRRSACQGDGKTCRGHVPDMPHSSPPAAAPLWRTRQPASPPPAQRRRRPQQASRPAPPTLPPLLLRRPPFLRRRCRRRCRRLRRFRLPPSPRTLPSSQRQPCAPPPRERPPQRAAGRAGRAGFGARS